MDRNSLCPHWWGHHPSHNHIHLSEGKLKLSQNCGWYCKGNTKDAPSGTEVRVPENCQGSSLQFRLSIPTLSLLGPSWAGLPFPGLSRRQGLRKSGPRWVEVESEGALVATLRGKEGSRQQGPGFQQSWGESGALEQILSPMSHFCLLVVQRQRGSLPVPHGTQQNDMVGAQPAYWVSR